MKLTLDKIIALITAISTFCIAIAKIIKDGKEVA